MQSWRSRRHSPKARLDLQTNLTEIYMCPEKIIVEKLTNLCMSVNAKSLFIEVYHEIQSVQSPVNYDPSLIEILAFYAYPHFNSVDKCQVTNVNVEECIRLLKKILHVLREENTIDAYVNRVRGLIYAHQTEEKIKVLGNTVENYFIKRLGFAPQRLLDIIKAAYRIEYNKRLSNQNLIICREDLRTAIACTEQEWQLLIEKLAITEEKRLNNIQDINDIRHCPIYALSNEYILLMPVHHLLEVVWEVFQIGIEKDEHWSASENFQQYNRARNDYLENSLDKFLKKIFPKEIVKKNIAYSHPDINKVGKPELDALVIWGDVALIFEAKAVRHFRPAPAERQGRNYFYSGYLQDSLVGSFNQANRFKKFFEETERSEVSKILKIDCSLVKQFYLFSITLEPLANFGFNIELLKEQSDLFLEREYPITISIDDLEVILDHCKAPDIFVDYIIKRSQLERSPQVFVSDELDLFAYYLKYNLLPACIKGASNYCSGYSYVFDEFYFKKYLFSDGC